MTGTRTISTILIANRGEIACRIIRTLRRMGIRSVAVYSDADANAEHVRLADTAWRLGPPPAADSYLRQDRLLDIAQRTGADAIHPGYGFLSENPGFSEACAKAGIKFIGPSAASISAMGSKSAAKALMETANVPLVPGYHGDDQRDDVLREHALRIGFPLLIKAAFGGGGKGMRVVENAAQFDESLQSCRREAIASFGNDTVLLERYLTRPRHVEIQIFCDQHGNAVHLFERDCSIQRRHQKIIEEAPAPGMTAELRAKMGDAAVAAARAIGYEGAGTIEFLLDADGSFYFMEMNTRLQVEHPVTEYITGQDLVEWQIRVARGETLPLAQADIPLHGHAIEARICAESPARNFMPSIGVIRHLATPILGGQVRFDTGVVQGSEISPYYDPMIGKLIVHGSDREDARRRMLSALTQLHMVGVDTNIHYLHQVMSLDAFAQADLTTRFLETNDAALAAAPTPSPLPVIAAALARTLTALPSRSPWGAAQGWQLNAAAERVISFDHQGEKLTVRLGLTGECFTACVNEQTIKGQARFDGARLDIIAESRATFDVLVEPAQVTVFIDGEARRFPQWAPVYGQGEDTGGGHLNAPMPGRVTAVLVDAGTTVKAGDPLVVMEAMKMEHTIRAPFDGVIDRIHHQVGDAVREGTELISLHPAE